MCLEIYKWVKVLCYTTWHSNMEDVVQNPPKVETLIHDINRVSELGCIDESVK